MSCGCNVGRERGIECMKVGGGRGRREGVGGEVPENL